jgi:hypothetical protein
MWQEGTLPTEWTEGIICTVCKKRDRVITTDQSLLNVIRVYKIFTILNNRFSNIVESKLEDCQMGFRLN